MKITSRNSGLILVENETWTTPFPNPKDGDTVWCAWRTVQLFHGQNAVEAHYYKRRKAAIHAMNRYDEPRLTKLMFLNGGWVSVPED